MCHQMAKKEGKNLTPRRYVSAKTHEQNARSDTPKTAETEFASLEDLLSEIKLAFQVPSGKVSFRGRTRVTSDLSTGTKERVQLAASEIWRVSGYQFR